MATEQEVLAHFKKVDSIMYMEAKRVGFHSMEQRKPEDYFMHLCGEIISQQLSNHVAKVIFTRFKELAGNIDAKSILKIADEDLRNVGMAWSKVGSIKDLANKITSGELNLEKLNTLDTPEIIEELTNVKGIGPWTAQMFLMFSLCREDIFSLGDLGLRRGIAKMYGIDKPLKEQIQEITDRWKPYRTYGSQVLWRSRVL